MVLTKAIDSLTERMASLGNSIAGAIAVADKFQKGTTALGLSYEGATKQFGTSIDQLRGGFIDRLNNGLVTLAEGFQGSTKGIAKLVNQQQLTNGAFRLTARRLATLESTLGMTREQTGHLADTILRTSLEYTITTDKLIDVLGALQQNAAALNVGGLQMLPETLTRLAGSFGPQLANDVKAFAQVLADPSMQNQLKLTNMGIGRIRENLASAASVSDQLDLLFKAILKGGTAFKDLAGDAKSFYTGISVPTQNLGKAAGSIYVLSQNINKREIQSAKNRALFGETLSNMRREIFVPIKEAFVGAVYPLARDLVMGLTDLLKGPVSKAAATIKSLVEGLPETTDGRLLFIAEKVGAFIDTIRMVSFDVANVFIELKNRVQNIANVLAAAYVDIEKFRADPAGAVQKLGEDTIGAGISDLLYKTGVLKAVMGTENAEFFRLGREEQRSERRARVTAAKKIDVDKGKIDIETLDANLAQKFLTEKLTELAAKRNEQLEGLPEAIANANKPTEIMESSFQTLGDVMATIAAQNTDDNPLLEQMLLAMQTTADNTTVRASALGANNGG
jgi:hypothetical protein